MGKAKHGLGAVALVGVGALLLAACGGSDNGTDTSSDGTPQSGGTLHLLTSASKILHLDPQRNYTGEDLAFANSYLNRTLTSYTFVEGEDGWKIQPDLATDTGTPNSDATSWEFTLRDGVSFEDGSPVTCDDIKYGVSRTFALDVVNQGPTYAIDMLDIPKLKDGSSAYKGPYDTSKDNDVAAFDKAIVCSNGGKTITFNLGLSVPDFNATVTLLAFSPVPKAVDQDPATGGENYDTHMVSTGPYKIQSYDKGRSLVLVRNENWDKASDPIRPAYPDEIDYEFSIDPNSIDQRLIADEGDDQEAIGIDYMQSNVLNQVFSNPQYADRAFNYLDPYSSYIAIDTNKVSNPLQRQAIMVALNRAERRTIYGGDYAGDLADGVIKSNFLGYEPTQLWDSLLGQSIPDTGDPEYAKQLIQQSGEPMPELQFDYSTNPDADKAAGALVQAEAKAGIKVTANPIDPGQYYGIVFDPDKAGELMAGGWGPDWSNASTIIPPLFASDGGWNLSRYDNPKVDDEIDAALNEIDLTKQAQMWNALNAEIMKDGAVIPTLFTKSQRMAGSNVHGTYPGMWAPYGSWPYGVLWVS
ncbi:MAG TPA: ABC transporter substrate-binding protein [Actinomycetes bacterium]|nr:ABC transporter substrate-binding protein [Actinomycetes bacterium]